MTLCEHFGLPPPSEDNKAMNALNTDSNKSKNNESSTSELKSSSNSESAQNGETSSVVNGNTQNNGASLSDLIKQSLTLENGNGSNSPNKDHIDKADCDIHTESKPIPSSLDKPAGECKYT